MLALPNFMGAENYLPFMLEETCITKSSAGVCIVFLVHFHFRISCFSVWI